MSTLPKKSKNTSTGSSKKADKNFTWTDEETALLLQVIIDYKSSKAALGLDWESVKSKYEDVCERLQSRYPKENSGVDEQEYPNCSNPSVISRDKIIPKIKRIKMQFRKAVDSGRRSGGGRVALSLYDECSEIWGGCPAVESLSNGIESSSMGISFTSSSANVEKDEDLLPDQSLSETASSETLDTSAKDDDEEESTVPKDMGNAKRNLIQHLKERKDSKLSKLFSVDAQLLDIANQEIKLKRRALEKMEEGEKKHEANMKMFAENMNTLPNVVSSGFGMLQRLMFQQNGFLNQPQMQCYRFPPHSYQQNDWGMQFESQENSQSQGASLIREVLEDEL